MDLFLCLCIFLVGCNIICDLFLDGITGVQYILDTVLQQLFEDPMKRFIYVEQAYFTRWFNELHDSTRHLVKELVTQGITLLSS